jgi:hypothetical protein
MDKKEYRKTKEISSLRFLLIDVDTIVETNKFGVHSPPLFPIHAGT